MEPREATESGAAQDGVDGGAGDAQPPPDAVWPPGEHAACSADGRFLQLIGLAGAAQGTAGAVEECVWSTFTEPPYPLGDGRGGDAEQAGHFGLGPASQHPFDQLGASHGGQSCVTMGHEGPPVTVGVALHNSNSEAPCMVMRRRGRPLAPGSGRPQVSLTARPPFIRPTGGPNSCLSRFTELVSQCRARRRIPHGLIPLHRH